MTVDAFTIAEIEGSIRMKKEGKGSSAAQAAPAEETEFSLISPSTLEALYANLLKGGMLAERLGPPKGPRDEGWEAVQAAAVAVLMDLVGEDLVATAEEIPLVRLLRGEKAAAVVHDRKQTATEAARAQEAANLLLHAVGAALANRTAAATSAAEVARAITHGRRSISPFHTHSARIAS